SAGAGIQNGSSWANAYPGTSLQSVIDLSSSGDEVWVAAGTYRTTTGTDRSISFSMNDGVLIYGSFVGTESALSQRSLTGGLTSILSGEIGAAGISDNSYRVIVNGNLTTASVLDGFVIRDGNDDRTPTASEGLGGGIYNAGSTSGNSSPTIRNCVIVNNRATFGAGIFNNGFNGKTSSPVISNCIITGNTATSAGGGIDNFGVTGNASPVITNCLIYNNTAPKAGGMYCWGGDYGNANPTVLNSAFVNNSAASDVAGGIIADNLNQYDGNSGSSQVVLRNSILWGNTASSGGPQFATAGTGTVSATYSIIDMSGQSSPHLLSGSVTGNQSSDPLFVNIASGIGTDGLWMTSDDGVRLQALSPAVNAGENAGVPTADIIGNTRIANGTVDIGPYEFGSSPLPVELISFTASVRGSDVVLRWNTATETMNHGFDIERRTGVAGPWQNAGFIPGNGTTNSEREYSFTEHKVTPAHYHSRLKQIDHDGRFSYVAETEATVGSVPTLFRLEQNYPNPFNPSTLIEFTVPSTGRVMLKIVNI
ncbi:MAG: choice-of-anchor Q domain-containing protein, partial [Bacteroidota bacterium]